jgi:hypothetical protein
VSAPVVPDSAGLAAALAERGIACRVEGRERLALLVPGDASLAVGDSQQRRAIHQLATRFGFTHVAIEVVDEASDAAGARA